MRQGWCISLRLPVHLRANNQIITFSLQKISFVGDEKSSVLLMR